MRNEIETMMSELVVELDETFAVALRCDSDEFVAVMYSTSAPMMPLYDRRGEEQLVGRGESAGAALDALNVRCSIR